MNALTLFAATLLQTPAVETAATEGAESPAGGISDLMLPLIVIMVLFYVIMLGPERKQRKKREEMLANLKKGQEVMTTGGMYGKIAAVNEDAITLLLAKDVRVRFNRSAIQGLSKEEEPAAEAKSSEPKTAEVVEA